MQTKLFLSCLIATMLTSSATASDRPNIVVILTDDPAESDNLIDEEPAKAREIEKLHSNWLDQMAPPASDYPKRLGDESADKDKAKKRAERKSARPNK